MRVFIVYCHPSEDSFTKNMCDSFIKGVTDSGNEYIISDLYKMGCDRIIYQGERIMAEEFLTLMADLDDDSQQTLSVWYEELKKAGFSGVQTPGLPFHISMGSFSLDKEADVIEEMKVLAARFSAIPVHISHIGLFAGGKVLYAAPDMNPADLLNLRHAIQTETQEKFPWTPHCTIIIDEAETIQKALPILARHFQPFMGRITKLHLCAFWPTREIATVFLEND